jgi:hypothetical protein
MNASGRQAVTYMGLICTALLLSAFSVRAAEPVAGKTFYTTANIWYEKPGYIESLNYHKGQILPLGTKVKIVKAFEMIPGDHNALAPQAQNFERSIRFVDDGGTSYTIVFNPRYAGNMTNWDFFRQYFSENDPMAEGGAFRSLTAEEQKSVLAGEIAAGMSKTAVVMAYGYPPGHKTPSLKSDKWIYWENRSKTRIVYFSDDKVKDEPGAGTKARAIKGRETKAASPIGECIKACKENTNRTPEQCFDACNH